MMLPTGRDLLVLAIALLLTGALLGVGCNAGCGYVREHVDIG